MRTTLPEILFDNDVVWKLCQLELLDDLAGSLSSRNTDLIVLSSLRFVIGPRVAKRANARCQEAFFTFIALASEADPTDDEILLAAQIEEVAMKEGCAVDSGESVLFAIATNRAGARVVTGDKRAAQGLAAVACQIASCACLSGAILTLEWLASALIARHGLETVRASVCAAPSVDKALHNCFQCASLACSRADVLRALGSYQRELSRLTSGFVSPSLAL